jgi:SulP family sulfate permease
LKVLLPAAFAIALLGAIESLLSAVVADGMTRTRHDPDAELVALGQGNMLGALFRRDPATGAFARTAANIRAGARSPISAMVHALFILLAVIFFGPIISKVPMAAMAALLLVVAYHMSEIHRVRQLLRIAPRSDILVLFVCFTLTVCFDMVIGVSVGIVLAALLFLRRMAGHTRGRVVAEGHAAIGRPIPKDVFVYEITGRSFLARWKTRLEPCGRWAKRAVGGPSDGRGVPFGRDGVGFIGKRAVGYSSDPASGGVGGGWDPTPSSSSPGGIGGGRETGSSVWDGG